ncbi:MAG TPA: ABC transporter substrate-binding protein [Dehalococcoidales bacterium]|nr:ABC transporter substrate-binding protein [Dehalococcoidales bacterium]
MRKRGITVLLVSLCILLVLALALPACAPATPTPTPTTTPPATIATPTPQPTPTTPGVTPSPTTPRPTTPTPTTPGVTTPTPAATPTVVKAPPSGTLRVATTDFAYESFDPIFYESFWGWAIYDPLITWDEKGNYVGSVAESWSISPDGNTWTFKIRRGIKFHNGDTLTAHDVKFSVDRFGSPESTNPWSRYLSAAYNKKSSTVVDDYTFQFVTNKPEPPLIIPFAWTRILPKTYFERVGQEAFRRAPIGSGPWKFVSFQSKVRTRLEANVDYWDKSRVPSFQFVVDMMVPEAATQLAMLRNNEVDIIGTTMDNVKDLQRQGFKTQIFGLPVLSNFSFQGSWLRTAGPVGDIRVRQAMSHAINRQEIADGYYLGAAVPGGYWFLHPGGYGWSDAWKVDAFDVRKARELLAAAGYPGKFPNPVINIYASPGPAVEFIQMIQGYWTAAGIQTRLNLVDATVWGGYFFNPARRITDGDPNVGWIFFWIFGSTQNSIYHSSNMFGSWGAHQTANDPKADEMYTAATTELDPVKALAKWTEFRTYAHSMYVNVGINIANVPMVLGPAVERVTGRTWISLQDAFDGFIPRKR